eukprot:934923-Pyramimonas_sp.AAC.1
MTSEHLFETFNASQGKRALTLRLERISALVVLVQEIGHLDWECEALSTWAGSRKWQMMVVPGKPKDGHLPSGGLAIFAREGV